MFDEVVEIGGFLIAMMGGVFITGLVIWMATYYAFSPTSCYATGTKMALKVEWAFSTGCMIELRGQWLPWSEVIPVERDGKIVFVPKPEIRLQTTR